MMSCAETPEAIYKPKLIEQRRLACIHKPKRKRWNDSRPIPRSRVLKLHIYS